MIKEIEKDITYAYLWQEMLLAAFTPENTGVWLRAYFQTFSDFLELDQPQRSPAGSSTINGSLDLINLDLWLEIRLRENQDFSIIYNNISSKIKWRHDSDPQFFTQPLGILLNHYNARSPVIAEYKIEDLKVVLNCAIFHPREHQHMFLDQYDHIRIGGGTTNPFLYLFQIRYQFCIIDEKCKKEQERLLDLFNYAIRNSKKIRPIDLFAEIA